MREPAPHLVIDIGNSGLKAACFLGDELRPPVLRLAGDDWSALDERVTNLGVRNILYATVANVPNQRWLEKWKAAGIGVFALDRSQPLPFASDYTTPDTLGQDRIAALAGTLGHMHTARLVVDAGSCVTLDLMDRHDRYLGGNISPGVTMRLTAMHERTARLPLVQGGGIAGAVGRSTEQALRHGGQLGVVYEIEGLYRRLLDAHPDLQLVLTGGDAPLLLSAFSLPVLHRPHLVLSGLHQILSTYVS
ncbi:Type III pantothenate kinase [Neolewinella maritima]|uniref:Type III pantothenate kinase n=1 Tax=Neolewinella maritima TaxID=1383882 RepID=A0ABN8F3K4_9BACT|nr:type III pantothenate kinase [Neolewinella maritima]CAH0998666.1 Type III pantothenate kinase [Neolewinella maritima]